MPKSREHRITITLGDMTVLGLRGWAERSGKPLQRLIEAIVTEELARQCARRRGEVPRESKP